MHALVAPMFLIHAVNQHFVLSHFVRLVFAEFHVGHIVEAVDHPAWHRVVDAVALFFVEIQYRTTAQKTIVAVDYDRLTGALIRTHF